MKNTVVDLDGTLIKLQANWPEVKEWVKQQLKPLDFKYDPQKSLDHNLFLVRETNPGRFNWIVKGLAPQEQVSIESAPINQDLVKELQNKPFALFTANARATALAALKLLNLKPEIIVAKEDVKKPKPSGDGLFIIMRKLDWVPGETVFIGDSDKDEQSALEAGVHFKKVNEF